MNLKFLTPQNKKEVEAHFELFSGLSQSLPYEMSEIKLKKYLKSTAPINTVVLYGDDPVSLFSLRLHNRTAELHGLIKPLKMLTKSENRLIREQILKIIFDTVFFDHDRHKLVVKASKENRVVRFFARNRGFKKLENTDKGQHVWVLDRRDHLRERGLEGVIRKKQFIQR